MKNILHVAVIGATLSNKSNNISNVPIVCVFYFHAWVHDTYIDILLGIRSDFFFW